MVSNNNFFMHRIKMLISLLLVLPHMISAQVASKTTKVSGQLAGNQVYTEISLRMPTKEVSVVATSPILQDGKYSLEFAQQETNIYKIFLADNNALLLILHPGDQVTLDLDAVNVNNNPIVKGSPETEAFYLFARQLNIYAMGLDSVQAAWKANQEKGASDSISNILRERYTYFDNLQRNGIANFIKNNPSNLACLAYIERLDIDENFDVFDAFDKASASKYANNPFVQDLHKRVVTARNISIGSMAPEIKLYNPDSVLVSLSSLRGKVVLIDFWASWCGPCRNENPHVVEVYKKYHDKGFDIFGVSLDRDGNNWRKAIKDDGLVWNQVSDLLYWKSEPAKVYGVGAIPYTVLIDRDGKIIAKKLRGDSLSQKLQEIFGF